MIRMCSIASGSSGNCIYIGTEDTHILVDAGISTKRIVEGLHSLGVEPGQLAGILVTHEHSDHIKGLPIFTKKYPIPVYATEHTLDGYLASNGPGLAAEGRLRIVEYGREFEIGGLKALPFPISHDAARPVSYTFTSKGHKLGMATDLGYYDNTVIQALEGSEILYLEANHDENMLMVGSYPYELKQRILGRKGHLSNDAAAELIAGLLHQGLKHIVLAHLSKENNYPELAYETVRQEVQKKWRFEAQMPDIMVANREKPSRLLELR